MQCALQAVQVMLASMQPCATGVSVANCTSTSSYANAHVALFSFPNMLTSALPNAISGCSGTATPIGAPNAANPTTTWYGPATLPIPGTAGSYVPLTYVQNGVAGKPTWSASYEVTYGAPGADANGFLSDYYDASNTTAGKLNPASSLIGAIGYTGTATKYGCLPVSPDGLNLNWSDDGDSPQWITPASVTFQSTTTVKVETTGTAGNLTFYAGAIYAAQQALLAEQQSMLTNFNKVTQNAIVLVGDGAQSSQWIFFPQGTMQQNISNTYYPPIAWPQALAAPTGPPSTQQIRLNALADYLPLNTATGALASTASSIAIGTNPLTSTAYPPGYDTLNTVPNYKSYIAQAYFSFPGYEYWDGGTTNRANTPKVGGVYITGLSSLSGYYPDFIDECQQSVIAGQYAANQGTKVFTVAYDSDNQGCNDYNSGKDIQHFNDVIQLPSTAFPRTLNDTTYSTLGNVNPCSTMENIASGLTNFYSDSGTGCTSPDHSTTDLKGILGAIGMTFTSPRLLPNNAT
jgi:hypothetical protein